MFICIVLLNSCSTHIPLESDPRLVVEGWIDDGGFPVVIVTTTIPVDEQYHEWQSVQDHVVRWAKVTVYDGEKEYVLTGKIDRDYYPPYIYTTSRLRGKVGKTYYLKVEYSGREVTAQTTIPASVPLQWLKVRMASNGQASITAGLKDNPMTEDYYKVFIKKENQDSIYQSALMGVFSDEILSEDVNVIEIRGSKSSKFGGSTSSIYHDLEDVVNIKFCTLEREPYCYWEDYEDVSLLSTNPLFPVNKPMRSNVSSGYGYWAGYGSLYYKVSIADSLKLWSIPSLEE